MKINTALILCAGFGKRLNPLTLDKPKPLLKFNDITLLENTINLVKDLGINKVILNTFYLKEKIEDFLNKKNFDISIKIIDDGKGMNNHDLRNAFDLFKSNHSEDKSIGVSGYGLKASLKKLSNKYQIVYEARFCYFFHFYFLIIQTC